MQHLVVIVVVICAVIGDGWAQNRGSSRYAAPEDYDGESTRAPRPAPNRGPGLRRQRTTKAPEPSVVEEELNSYQPPKLPARTSGRRNAQRDSPRQVAPPPPPVPVEEAVPLYPAPGSEIPQSPPSEIEGKPQGTRRRRPKKRRKPQASVPQVDEEPVKQIAGVPENDKVAISELLNDDRKRTEEFQNNPQLRNAPRNFNSDPNLNIEKSTWDGNPSERQSLRNTGGSQYFRPQPTSNRLPIDDSDNTESSRGYLDSSIGSPNEYAPRETPNSVRDKASYVPILTPFRGTSEGASRLPSEDYPLTRNKEANSQTLPIDPDTPYLHGNRAPGRDPNEAIRNPGAQPVRNIIPQPNEPAVPVRGHSEVRLPENEQPIFSPDYGDNFESAERLPVSPQTNEKTSDGNEEPANPTNRLPTPSEIHYDSVYPEFSEGTQRTSGRRHELAEPNVRRTPPSYTTPRRDGGTKPHEYDNDAEVDRRQVSQYRPPLQRTSSRYKSEDLDEPTKIRTQQPPSTSPPRSRGSSRHQPSTDSIASERTRSSTRHSPEPSDNPPSRSSSSSSQSQSSSRTRGTQRYAPETIESVPRSSSRRQPENINAPPPTRNPEYPPPTSAYVPIDEIIESDRRSPPQVPRPHSPTPENIDNVPDDRFPIRNTLRSRPQHEVRDSERINAYDDSLEDPDDYNTEYQVVRQPTTRGRTNQRQPAPRQQPAQPEYRTPTNRQQNTPEPHYEAPQNPRSRQQHQYQTPQNPRADPRESSPRQNAPSSRQQGRPRQAGSEAPATRGRSSGGSNFKCPDDFGFYSDPVQCDKYYECRNGTATMILCSDGLAFNEVGVPNFVRCDSLRDVDCKSRPELQEAQPTEHCPRRFGLYAHETDCTKFWNCVDGTSTEVQCPPGLAYSDKLGTCDWADLVESSCKAQDLLGFTCPEPTDHDLMDGVYTRYRHPTNCQLHFTCIKGADGLRRPRMLSCNEGLVFDPESASCKRPEEVAGCEEYYGPPSPPKRKPSRQPASRDPEPEEEYIEEEPTPRPRRRGSSNRRTRN